MFSGIPLCRSPIHLNVVQFAMELWVENHLVSHGFDSFLHHLNCCPTWVARPLSSLTTIRHPTKPVSDIQIVLRIAGEKQCPTVAHVSDVSAVWIGPW